MLPYVQFVSFLFSFTFSPIVKYGRSQEGFVSRVFLAGEVGGEISGRSYLGSYDEPLRDLPDTDSSSFDGEKPFIMED